VSYRVVLVDDVPEIRQILRLILEHAGPFEVVGEGRNGSDAVELAKELRPDLVVMDVEMRGGPTGWQALPHIREASPSTAVVILSGSAADPMRTEREYMADGVLEKGMPPQELNDALLDILGAPRRPVPPPPPMTATEPASDIAAIRDALSEAVIELDADRAVRTWNRAAERIYGTSAADAIGRRFDELGAARADVAVTEVALRDGVAVVARDLAATQASDQAMAWAVAELESKRRELERKGRELDGFASVASHDIAQPLQVAYGYLEMVRSEFAEGMDETAAAWIDAAVASLERMRVLVQDILAYARAGSRDTPPAQVSLEDVAQAALSSIEDALDERAGAVNLHGPLPIVGGNEEHLVQVIEQLLDNAVRFVPDDRVPVVDVSAEELDDEWVVTVADNGHGIAPELTERVFDVFYRGGKASVRGTGLGLSLARKLVERMGGRIWVEAATGEGGGARVRFALPKVVT
jgi:signal transduction histidine kinase